MKPSIRRLTAMTCRAYKALVRLTAVTAVVLTAAGCSGTAERQRMLGLLEQAEEKNRNYESLSGDSVLKDVAAFMDAHGTAHDQMRAHYILGCHYRDREQAPEALEQFHEAIDRADTTAADCDFRTLSRIHGQAADILHFQNLFDEELKMNKKGVRFALMGKDTLSALAQMGRIASCYFKMGNHEKALSASLKAVEAYLEYGDTLLANTELAPAIYIYLIRKDFDAAKPLLDRYEYRSFLSGKEPFTYKPFYLLYHYKGLYFLGKEQLDSASYCFSKQIYQGETIDNIVLGYRGLYQLYKQTNNLDSIVKYADLSYDYKDSVLNASVYANLQNMMSLYDYSVHQRKAEQEAAKSIRLKTNVLILSFLVVILLLLSVVVVYVIRQRAKNRIRRLSSEYALEILTYHSLKSEIKALAHEKTENHLRIEQLERQLDLLRQSIAEKQDDKQGPDKWEMTDILLDSLIVKKFHAKAANGGTVTDQDWQDLRKTVNDCMPRFMDMLYQFDYQLSQKETNVCILVKLRFVPTELCNLLGMGASAVSNMRSRLYQKLFKEKGTATAFDDRIRKIPC